MVFIIGEIGTNHLGDLNIAKKIIQCAVNTGFDAVKFQKKNVEKIYTQEFLNSPLDSPWGTTQREMRLHREFSDKQFTHCGSTITNRMKNDFLKNGSKEPGYLTCSTLWRGRWIACSL